MLQEADIGVGISGVEGMQVLWTANKFECWQHMYICMLIILYIFNSGCYVKWCCNCSISVFGAAATCTWTLVLSEDLSNGNSIHMSFNVTSCFWSQFFQFRSLVDAHFIELFFLLLFWWLHWHICCFVGRYATSCTKTLHLASLFSYMKHLHHSLRNLHTMIGLCPCSVSSSLHFLWLLWVFLTRMFPQRLRSRYKLNEQTQLCGHLGGSNINILVALHYTAA